MGGMPCIRTGNRTRKVNQSKRTIMPLLSDTAYLDRLHKIYPNVPYSELKRLCGDTGTSESRMIFYAN